MTNRKTQKRKIMTPPKLTKHGDPNETQEDLPDTGTNAFLPRKKPRTAKRKKERDRKKLIKKRKKEEEKPFGRLATKLQTDINKTQ